MNIYHDDDIPEYLKQYFEPAPQIGLEKTPEEYVNKLVEVFREVKRVLRDDGTLWLNLGDSYSTPKEGNTETNKNPNVVTSSFKKELPIRMKPKNLVGIPWRVAFALQADGWYLRQDIIWHKPNPMPESVTDRCTKSHEYIFLLAKSQKYYFDNDALKEKTNDINTKPRSFRKSGEDSTLRNDKSNEYIPRNYRNKRSVWTVNTKPFKEAHFATFPEELIRPMVLAGTSIGYCNHCGKPMIRIIEKGDVPNREPRMNMLNVIPGRDKLNSLNSKDMVSIPKITKGWKFSCDCQNNYQVKGIILDPFFGAGTTGVVAIKNDRNYIGIELNKDYIAIAEKRIKEEEQYTNKIF